MPETPKHVYTTGDCAIDPSDDIDSDKPAHKPGPFVPRWALALTGVVALSGFAAGLAGVVFEKSMLMGFPCAAGPAALLFLPFMGRSVPALTVLKYSLAGAAALTLLGLLAVACYDGGSWLAHQFH